jgi:hypothetical protein
MMKRDYAFLTLFVVILITSFIFIYQNSESLDCSMERSFGDVMSDISYEFEPNGSSYGNTKILRFFISSYRGRIEYYGMEVTDKDGKVLYFENLTNHEGGSLSASFELEENESVNVKRFFKKKCFPEVVL